MLLGINFWAVLVCGVIAMVVGFVWYGPLFGRTWMKIVGATELDEARRAEMQKKAGPLYFIQFVLVLFQLFVLGHMTGYTGSSGVVSALWAWAGFVMPTIAASSMWNNDSTKVSWTRFFIQAGYQLICFVIFGFILGVWH